MPAEIILLPVWDKAIQNAKGTVTVMTVSKSNTAWERQLSPFLLGPCKLYGDYHSINMENAWQYAKVYTPEFWHSDRLNKSYWKWAVDGWSNARAVRYPMGKGRSPAFSLWDGEALDYIEARKRIYGPLYAEAVQKTEAWRRLKKLYKTVKRLVLYDYDVRDISRTEETLTEVLNNPHKKMGHAFVLAMLLQRDPALEQLELR